MKPKNFLNSIIKPLFGHKKKAEEELEAIAAKEQKAFRYESLAAATDNFSPKLKLGQGGYGPVFKGRLEDGRVVAVKQLGQGSRQGAKEFKNEANLLSKVQHKNVVNLYGYCAHAHDKLLVYEYVANESLDKILFSSTSSNNATNLKRPQLDWKLRYDIMVGIARGLLYLHEDAHTPIVHRDIKASNILLDEKWNPKIADFGMARLFPEDKERTHVNTRVVGTNGYMAPEYVLHGYLSTKVDVYSFGVLVLELISGRKNSSFFTVQNAGADNLIEWAWNNFKKGQSEEILEPSIKPSADLEQVKMCVHIGLLCTESDPKMRPDMNRVVVVLSKKPSRLEEPTRPGVPSSSFHRKGYGSGVSSYSSGATSSSARNSGSSVSVATTHTATTSTTRTAVSSRPPPKSPIRFEK